MALQAVVQKKLCFFEKNVIIGLIFRSITDPYIYLTYESFTGVTISYRILKNGEFFAVVSTDLYDFSKLQYKNITQNYMFMITSANINDQGSINSRFIYFHPDYDPSRDEILKLEDLETFNPQEREEFLNTTSFLNSLELERTIGESHQVNQKNMSI